MPAHQTFLYSDGFSLRWKYDRAPVFASCVTIPNPDSLLSLETGSSWDKKFKKKKKTTCLYEVDVRKPLAESIVIRGSSKSRDSPTWFVILQFQAPARKHYLQTHLLLGNHDQNFLKQAKWLANRRKGSSLRGSKIEDPHHETPTIRGSSSHPRFQLLLLFLLTKEQRIGEHFYLCYSTASNLIAVSTLKYSIYL
jgi:hypothetical protein